MKIYLATSAPGNETIRERGMLNISKRLLSYYHIQNQLFECHKIFEVIRSENLSCRRSISSERKR